jgi:hypothetical protein
VKLGKLPKKVDPRTLQFARYATVALTPAGQCHNGGAVKSIGMLANDSLGDCAEAAAGHAEEVWSAREAGQVALTDAQAIAMYSAVTGYNPDDPNSDQGTVLLDLLNDWCKTSYYVSAISAYVEIDATDVRQHQLAIDLFGVSYIGVELPNSVLPNNGVIVPWTVDPATGGENAPNPDNGHCIVLTGYDIAQEMFWGMTWGAIVAVSFAFVEGCCDEAYGLLSPQWLEKGKSPTGFDLAQLTADLAALGRPTAIY